MVEKRKKVMIFMEEGLKIKGEASLREGFRLMDYLNSYKHFFFPLNNVEIYNQKDELIFKTDFICINKNNILFAKEEVNEV